MGDAYESLRAVKEIEKQERRVSWEARGEAIAQIEARGFKVEAKGTDQMHFRIRLSPGRGYVDFWPSTWRWHHKMKHAPRPIHHGNGLKPMLSYLMGRGEPAD